MFNLKALSAFALMASSVLAASVDTVAKRDNGITYRFEEVDARQVVSFNGAEYDFDWCTRRGYGEWDFQCERGKPLGTVVLKSSCQMGDKEGNNVTTRATVLCVVGNTDIPGHETWLTGYAITMAGPVMPDGAPPRDVDECIN